MLADQPEDIFTLITAARVARHLGQLPRARLFYQRALALRPALDDLRAEMEQMPAEDA